MWYIVIAASGDPCAVPDGEQLEAGSSFDVFCLLSCDPRDPRAGWISQNSRGTRKAWEMTNACIRAPYLPHETEPDKLVSRSAMPDIPHSRVPTIDRPSVGTILIRSGPSV